jgi:hypothetical protein
MCIALLPGESVATASVMPRSISLESENLSSGDNSISAVIRVVTGPDGAQFGLEYELPHWPYPSTVLGSPLYVAGIELIGPGRIQLARSGPVLLPSHSYRSICQRNIFSTVGSSFWIELPADSLASVVLTMASTYSAWPGTNYSASFFTFEANDSMAVRTPLGIINAMGVAPNGTRISMRTTPRTAEARLTRGISPPVIGWTNPPLRFRRIALRVVRPTRTGSVSLAQWSEPKNSVIKLGAVHTDGKGHFRLERRKVSTPEHLGGPYAFLARSAPSLGITADWNCGPFFTVRPNSNL